MLVKDRFCWNWDVTSHIFSPLTMTARLKKKDVLLLKNKTLPNEISFVFPRQDFFHRLPVFIEKCNF